MASASTLSRNDPTTLSCSNQPLVWSIRTSCPSLGPITLRTADNPAYIRTNGPVRHRTARSTACSSIALARRRRPMSDQFETSFYSLLGVSSRASSKEIQAAYIRLSREFHPDSSTEAEAEERYKLISWAYAVLVVIRSSEQNTIESAGPEPPEAPSSRARSTWSGSRRCARRCMRMRSPQRTWRPCAAGGNVPHRMPDPSGSLSSGPSTLVGAGASIRAWAGGDGDVDIVLATAQSERPSHGERVHAVQECFVAVVLVALRDLLQPRQTPVTSCDVAIEARRDEDRQSCPDQLNSSHSPVVRPKPSATCADSSAPADPDSRPTG